MSRAGVRARTGLVVRALLAASLLGAPLAAVAAPGEATAEPTPSTATPAAAPAVPAGGGGTRGKVAGFGVPLAGKHEADFPVELPRMRSAGGNTVMLDVVWDVRDRTSSDLRPSEATVSDETLLAAAERARSVGMDVMLTIKIVCRGCSTTWRGALKPDDEGAFFERYTEMAVKYADLAQRGGISVFFVGSEMNSLQGRTDRWRKVILETRRVYTGRIGYEVNWDSLSGPQFWSDVDVAGVSAYFPLSSLAQPNVADLLEHWQSSYVTSVEGKRTLGKRWVEQLRALAQRSGKPVLFGEVGYQSAQYATEKPYAQYRTDGWDEQLQSDAYQAVLTTFEDEPWWLGVIWWEWKVTSAGPGDLDYSPRGKLAEEMLRRWYRGERPPSRTTSLVGETRPSAQPPNKPATPPPAPAKAGTAGPTSKPDPRPRPATTAPRPTRPRAVAPDAPSAAPRPTVPVPAGTGTASAAPLPGAAPDAPPPQAAAPAAPGAAALDLVPVVPAEETEARIARLARERQVKQGAAGLIGLVLLGLLGVLLADVRSGRVVVVVRRA